MYSLHAAVSALTAANACPRLPAFPAELVLPEDHAR